MKKKICVVTAARSEYGHLRWIIQDILDDCDLELQLVVTGGHLLQDQGHTVDQIIEDGIPIAATVDAKVDNSTTESICYSMSRMQKGVTKAFSELEPDILVVLGDRYELLPICTTAFVMGIPIAHISGGDITEGAIDDGVRNAVTMLATYHFPGTQSSADNIIRMHNSDKNVYVVGEPSLDLYNRISLMSREELSHDLCIESSKKWILMTYHPETKKSVEYNVYAVENCLKALHESCSDYEIVVTKSNTDLGGKEINQYIENFVEKKTEFKLFPSLGQLRYVSFMKQVDFVIGNSSSGIVETPLLGVPAINIGNRQRGRYQCKNIFQSCVSFDSIQKSISRVLCESIDFSDKEYWGSGFTSYKIVSILKNV